MKDYAKEKRAELLEDRNIDKLPRSIITQLLWGTIVATYIIVIAALIIFFAVAFDIKI